MKPQILLVLALIATAMAVIQPFSGVTTASRDFRLAAVYPGKPIYLDRSHVFLTVPELLLGLPFIATTTENDVLLNTYKVGFQLHVPATVFVAVDEVDAPAQPQWLNRWGLQSEKLTVMDERSGFNITYALYAKVLPAGPVELGPNVQSTSTPYVVIIKPASNFIFSQTNNVFSAVRAATDLSGIGEMSSEVGAVISQARAPVQPRSPEVRAVHNTQSRNRAAEKPIVAGAPVPGQAAAQYGRSNPNQAARAGPVFGRHARYRHQQQQQQQQQHQQQARDLQERQQQAAARSVGTLRNSPDVVARHPSYGQKRVNAQQNMAAGTRKLNSVPQVAEVTAKHPSYHNKKAAAHSVASANTRSGPPVVGLHSRRRHQPQQEPAAVRSRATYAQRRSMSMPQQQAAAVHATGAPAGVQPPASPVRSRATYAQRRSMSSNMPGPVTARHNSRSRSTPQQAQQ